MNRRSAAVVTSIAIAASVATMTAAAGATTAPPTTPPATTAAPTTAAASTLPPTTIAVDTSFLRGQAETQFLDANPDATQVACAAPAADEPGVLFNCYAVGADGALVAAVATMNDDGGIEFTPLDVEASSGATTTTVAPTTTSGTGSEVIAVSPASGPSIVVVTHDGAGEFSIQPQNAGAPIGQPFAVGAGAIAGSYLVVFTSPVSDFAVTADGAWTVEVAGAATAPALAADAATAGDQPGVLAVSGPDEFPLAVDYQGSGRIVVTMFSASGLQTIVDETGPFTGEVTLPAGPGYVGVDAAGAWTLIPAAAAETESTGVG